MSRLSEALDCFTKLHTIVPGTPQLVYHIADWCVCVCVCVCVCARVVRASVYTYSLSQPCSYDKLDDFNQATDW